MKPKEFLHWLYLQNKKNFIKRLSWWSLIAVIALLGDEYLKEGCGKDNPESGRPLCSEDG